MSIEPTEDTAPSAPSAPSDPSSITGKLCSWINTTTIDSIPDEVITRAKYLILDGVACAIVAAHLSWSETAAKGIFSTEPRQGGQCTVIGWGESNSDFKKLSPLAATVLNSAFIQGFELDDYHSAAPLHSNSLLLPALFAATELVADPTDNANSTTSSVSDSQSQPITISGQEFLRSYIIGCEVGPRVGLALHGADLLSRGWHSGALQGPSATAASVSSLLHLTPSQIESALGIACTQAGGLMSAQFGSMAKRMQHGFAARNGLTGVLLARKGYTGIEQVYETPYGGFLSCFSQGSSFSPAALPEEIVSGLGQRWEIERIRVKLHASMAALHAPIDCADKLQHEHPKLFTPANLENIESITTQHATAAYEHGGWLSPPDKPMTSMSAQMSIQYAVAAQLIDGQVLMAQFSAEKLNRPQLRELMQKVRPVLNKSFDSSKEMQFKTVMSVKFKDGNEVETTVDAPRGVQPPVSNEDIVDKWRRLVDGVLEEERRQKIEECVLGLEKLDDVRTLIGLLAGRVECPISV